MQILNETDILVGNATSAQAGDQVRDGRPGRSGAAPPLPGGDHLCASRDDAAHATAPPTSGRAGVLGVPAAPSRRTRSPDFHADHTRPGPGNDSVTVRELARRAPPAAIAWAPPLPMKDLPPVTLSARARSVWAKFGYDPKSRHWLPL